MNCFSKKPISIVLGAAFALSGLAAQASVFQAADLGAGYMVAAAGEGKCGEGKCGEGKGAMMFDANKDGKLTLAEHQAHWAAQFKKTDANADGFVTMDEMKVMKGGEGKCGEGKCGEGKKAGETK